MASSPLADLRRRLRAAGLNNVVAPVAARVPPTGEGDDFVLAALVEIGPDERLQIAQVMGASRYVIDTRRFSDGYWSQTR
jgi:hypothetical protein